jgi:hypothetical protein
MAGLYNRMVDPNFATPMRGGVSPNAGLGAPGSAGLPRQQEDDFNAAQMAGLLGMMAKQKKPGEEAASAAPGALDAAQPGMTPITNGGNFDMAQAMPGVMPGMQGQLPGSAAFQDNTGMNTGFAMPPSGSGEAFQLGNVGGNGPLMSNFGGGIPASTAANLNPVAGMQLPVSIGGAGIDPAQLQGILGGFGFGGGAGA